MTGYNDKYPIMPHLPDYMMLFGEGRQRPDYQEQLAATFALHAAVEDKVMESLHGLSAAKRSADVCSELALDSFDYNGEPVELTLSCVDTVAHPGLPEYSVSLLAGPRRSSGNFMNAHEYAVPGRDRKDEVTTRRDITLQELPKIVLPPRVPENQPRHTRREAINDLLRVLYDAEQNQQLEKELGINSQPIGLAEARAIALFIFRGNLKMPQIVHTKKG